MWKYFATRYAVTFRFHATISAWNMILVYMGNYL
jgi:hypothetical protein